MSTFKKAERRQTKLKLAITGVSGSGKTYSALRLAKGLGGKVALIDTENGSASLYSDRFEFDVMEISAPYSNEKYLAAMQTAQKAGYNVLIIDSLSHQWAGEGGILNRKEQLDARGGNSFANWAKMTPEHEKFKAAILHADMHVIGTIRSKTEYTLSENDKGKIQPKKVGLAPVQRDQMEYEFTVVFDVAMNHEADISKDRTGLFAGKIFQITEETGEQLVTWLGTAKPVAPPEPPKWEPAISDLRDLNNAAVGNGWNTGQIQDVSRRVYLKQSPRLMTLEEFRDFMFCVANMSYEQAIAEGLKQPAAVQVPTVQKGDSYPVGDSDVPNWEHPPS